VSAGGPRARFAVSPVGEEDLEDLLPLVRAYCDFYGASPTDVALLGLSRALIADPAREGVQYLAREVVDVDDDNVDQSASGVGFATVFWTWSTTRAARIGTMNDLFVAPEARGSGAAEALIEACADACREHGAIELEWSTRPDNLRAQALYERVGARRDQPWIDYTLPVEPGTG
jgi:GNAT superfamily N-acetyltransferase